MNSAERLAIQFQGNLREQILATLPHGDEDRPVLETLDLSDLLIKHMNWTSRLVVARPRRVFLSSVLTSKRPLDDGMCDEALSQLIIKIRSGADITPHLSRNVSVGVDLRPTSSRTRRRDLDLMLDDWGVHHLHLSGTKEADGFVKRTGPVLFAAFQPDRAYLIDVVQHGKRNPDAWTQGGTLETIAREWPNAGLILEMKGILSGQAWTAAERRQLRAKGYASSIEVDGKTYMPRLGLTTAGTAIIVAQRAIRLGRHLKIAAQEISSRRGPLWDGIRATCDAMPEETAFRFLVYADGYGLADAVNETFIWLDRW